MCAVSQNIINVIFDTIVLQYNNIYDFYDLFNIEEHSMRNISKLNVILSDAIRYRKMCRERHACRRLATPGLNCFELFRLIECVEMRVGIKHPYRIVLCKRYKMILCTGRYVKKKKKKEWKKENDHQTQNEH